LERLDEQQGAERRTQKKFRSFFQKKHSNLTGAQKEIWDRPTRRKLYFRRGDRSYHDGGRERVKGMAISKTFRKLAEAG